MHADPRVADAAADLGLPTEPATEEDWRTEYIGLDLAVGVVDSLDDALAHIRRYSSGHTEAICTADVRAADRFVAEVDSAAVVVSTRPPGSPTAPSSASAPRSASPPRSCTPAGRWGWPS